MVTNAVFVCGKFLFSKLRSKKESAFEKRARYVEQRAKGLLPQSGKDIEPDYDSAEEEEIIKAELARLPAEMRARVKVCLKEDDGDDSDDLDGIEQSKDYLR